MAREVPKKFPAVPICVMRSAWSSWLSCVWVEGLSWTLLAPSGCGCGWGSVYFSWACSYVACLGVGKVMVCYCFCLIWQKWCVVMCLSLCGVPVLFLNGGLDHSVWMDCKSFS